MKRLSFTKRDITNLSLIALVVFLVLVAIFLVMRFSARPETSVHLGTETFQTTVARSDIERTRGLSGTQSLLPGEGMLFVFPRDDTWAIWMKDMRYPIDVIWLSGDKRVVAIQKSVKPETYPNSFAPNTPARYVLELSAGSADRAAITVDKTATFSDNNT